MFSWNKSKKKTDPPEPEDQNDSPKEADKKNSPKQARKKVVSKPDSNGLSPEAEESPKKDPYALVLSEKWWAVFWQILVIFLVTAFGSVGTGVLLTHISTYNAFVRIKDLYLLIPVLQSFKGNVDACLGARLSTQANLGNLNTKPAIVVQIISNIALTQVQCIVGALIISVYILALGSVEHRKWSKKHAFLLTFAAITTNCVTCFILDLILMGLILLSKRYNINPDNVICPIAATAADLITLLFFSASVDAMFDWHHKYWWGFVVAIIFFILAILPLGIVYALKVPETKVVLFRGWYVLLFALVFNCLGSIILDAVVERYRGYVLFQPVLNNTTVNFATILCTRLSTMLYETSYIGTYHPKIKPCASPLKVWFRGTPQAKCIHLLMVIGIPGQLLFLFLADFIYTKGSNIRPAFIFSYIFVSTVHMMTVMYISYIIVHTLWRYKIDPDNAAIPIVSAVGEFIGSSLLASDFAILIVSHQEYLHGLFGDHEH